MENYKVTTKVKSLIRDEVSMGTYGLVELEVRALEKSHTDLLEALIEINGLCADASKIENGKVDYSLVAKISINAINKALK